MKVHSIVGIITNSSTEIFSFPVDNAVEIAKKLLKDFIPEGAKAEDFFNISVQINEDTIDDAMSDPYMFIDDWEGYDDDKDWKQNRDAYIAEIGGEDKLREQVIEYYTEKYINGYDREGYPHHYLSFKILPGVQLTKPLDIMWLYDQLITSEAIYC